ncbi:MULTISPECIES: hypothetical protein [unclassified Leifsonia]|uniref:hypothetical protein n=1 Tax=unclassified Leifsonia TaxID=2663824 RepID=UPI0006F8E245|nr:MULTISPECIES: hypothetical protein [unclassified Leifsonia]KQX07213.1 hypothetical protein ASC59_05295 [Leifsonia sp. Root1293]KRA11496.1 hypothetical protein ASD61_05295 [Leifsonia sp. Root60]
MHRIRATRAFTRTVVIAGLALVLTGCTPSGEDSVVAPSTTAAAQSTSTPASSPTESATAAPTVTPLDSADVSSWVISAQGIGPIVRGADFATTAGSLPGFDPGELCRDIVIYSPGGITQIVIELSDQGTRISNLWVLSGADRTVPSPETEAGIRVGSTMEELSAAYPDLTTDVQRGHDTWVYSDRSDPEGVVDFVVNDDTVFSIGATDGSGTPKEWCS